MSTDITVAVIALIGTTIGTFSGIMASTKMSNYRIQELEERVEKHNDIVERTFIMETKIESILDCINRCKSKE